MKNLTIVQIIINILLIIIGLSLWVFVTPYASYLNQYYDALEREQYGVGYFGSTDFIYYFMEGLTFVMFIIGIVGGFILNYIGAASIYYSIYPSKSEDDDKDRK